MCLIPVVTLGNYGFVIVFPFVTLLLTPSNYSGSLHINQMHIVMYILNLLDCLPSLVILLHNYYNMRRAFSLLLLSFCLILALLKE